MLSPGLFEPAASLHRLHLFDTTESFGHAAAQFLQEGQRGDERVLLIARSRHIDAVADALAARGLALGQLAAGAAVTILDASLALRPVMRRHVPDPAAFADTIGAQVRRLATESGRPVRVLSELADLLTQEGNHPAAASLEHLLDELSASVDVHVLCVYSSAHFAVPSANAALSAVCARHASIDRNDDDLLAEWLLNEQRSRAAVASARAALGS